MLSDRGIVKALKYGALSIYPFEWSNLGPCSYDLTIERIRRPKKETHLDCSLEEFVEKHCEPYNGVLGPRRAYIGVSKEKVNTCLRPEITVRSSIARLGIELSPIQLPINGDFDHVYFLIRTFGTTCEIPEGIPMVQLVSDHFIPIQGEGLRTLLQKCVVKPNMDVFMEEYSAIRYAANNKSWEMLRLHLGDTIKEYNGKALRYGENNDNCFREIDIIEGYELTPENFYLAFTEEWVEMPRRFSGMLRRSLFDIGGDVHTNAPLVAPGSCGNQVLEMWYRGNRFVKGGRPICGLEVYALDQEPTNAYGGRYKNQKGAQTNIPDKKAA